MSRLVLTGRGFERCDAAEASERGFIPASPRVGPGDEDLRGDESADSWLVEQRGADLADDREHRQLEFAAFNRQLLDPGRGAAQGEFGRGVLRVGRCVWAEPDASVDELPERVPAEVLPKIDGRGDNERLEHVDRGDTGEFRGIPGNDERAQALTKSPRSWRRPGLATERLACRANGVKRIGLRSVLRCAGGRVVELDHELALLGQGRSEAGAVAARRLDRPGPALVDGKSLRPPQGLTVSPSRRWECLRRKFALRGDAHDRRSYAVAVRVDTDHVVDEFCEISHFDTSSFFDEIHRRRIEAGL